MKIPVNDQSLEIAHSIRGQNSLNMSITYHTILGVYVYTDQKRIGIIFLYLGI